jgi:D-arabinonate dehydratase
MRIASIEAIPLRMKLPRVFHGSSFTATHRCTSVTRVYTDEGVVGECYAGDEREEQAEIVHLIDHEIAPRLIGGDVFRHELLWETMLQASLLDLGRRRRAARAAQGCVDAALWDARGKALGVPLCRLWGAYRDELITIADAGYYEDGKTLAQYGEEIEELRRMPIGGCKFKVGGRTPKEDAERVRVARQAAGPDFYVAVDANQGYSLSDATLFARLIEDLDILWLEEPVRWSTDHRLLAKARAATRIPISAGQSEISREGCRDLMLANAIDFCNFDGSLGGGPTEWLRVAAMASCFGVEMCHHEEPQLSAQLLSAIPHGRFIDVFQPERDPLYYALFENRSPFENGCYRVPQEPGWGMHLDKKIIERYRA